MVHVDGNRSRWANSGNLSLGYASYSGSSTDMLSISGGGTVTATGVSINNNSSLVAIDVGRGSLLSISSSGTLSNGGTVRILAGAGVPVAHERCDARYSEKPVAGE